MRIPYEQPLEKYEGAVQLQAEHEESLDIMRISREYHPDLVYHLIVHQVECQSGDIPDVRGLSQIILKDLDCLLLHGYVRCLPKQHTKQKQFSRLGWTS